MHLSSYLAMHYGGKNEMEKMQMPLKFYFYCALSVVKRFNWWFLIRLKNVSYLFYAIFAISMSPSISEKIQTRDSLSLILNWKYIWLQFMIYSSFLWRHCIINYLNLFLIVIDIYVRMMSILVIKFIVTSRFRWLHKFVKNSYNANLLYRNIPWKF